MGRDSLRNRKDLVRYAKRRARELNLPFTLTIEDIEIPQVCPVLGIPLFRGVGTHVPNSPSLDRIVPAKGYVPGNVLVVSRKANLIKSNATPEEIIQVGEFYKDHRDEDVSQNTKHL